MKRTCYIIPLLLTGILLFPSKYYAASNDTSEVIKVYMGEMKVLPVSNPSRIVLGNPAVADIVSATKAELTINPKAPGVTSLVFWDNFGEQSYQVKVFNDNIQEIKRRIDYLLAKLNLSNVSTQAEEEEGKVFLMGSIKTAQEREKINLVLGDLVKKTVDLLAVKEEETAVDIDVQVLELDKDATNTLGFTSPGSVTLTEVGSPMLGAAGAGIGSIFRTHNFTRAAYSWTLDALIQEGKARILSRPRLTCQSGKEAELLVGGEKPTFTTQVASAGGNGTSIEYKEYGIKLKIKPTVNEDSRIKISLNVDISEVGDAETIGSASAPTGKAYPVTKRTVSTELFLNDEQTLSIGGLIKQKEEEDVRRTPFLSDIPVFGLFFRKKTTKQGGGQGNRGNTELFITLTPKIVNTKANLKPGDKKEPDAAKTAKAAITAAAVIEDESLSPDMKKYIGIVQKRIIDNLAYPVAAKESGFQGSLKLNLHLSYLGELKEVTVKKSSGYKILDDNAVESAKKLISFPPFPTSIEQKEMWVDIPIEYRLD